MSQKTGKRTRKHAEGSSSPQTVSKKDENVETVLDDRKDVSVNEKSGDDNANNVEKDELETKDKNLGNSEKLTENMVDNCQSTIESKETEVHSSIELNSSQEIIETEASEKVEKCKSETELESENEMEPLVLEEQSNGVQILIENTDEVKESSEELTQNEDKEKIESKDIISEENKVNDDKEPEKDDEDLKTQSADLVNEKIIEMESTEAEDVDSKSKKFTLNEMNDLGQSDGESLTETFSEISTEAVVGSDTTRLEENFEYSKFLTVTKDRTIGESIRHLSGRRSIRTVRNYFPTDGNAYNLNSADGRKRKNYEDECLDIKRAKRDSSGLMSYFGYSFKKSDVTSSTPKLTGYKTNSFDDNISKVSLDSTNEKSSNKWCSVM